MIDTTYRYPSFSLGHTVGELQGEMQRPPESLRKGRLVVLTQYPIVDLSIFDTQAQTFVTYLDRPAKAEQYLFGEGFSLIMEDECDD